MSGRKYRTLVRDVACFWTFREILDALVSNAELKVCDDVPLTDYWYKKISETKIYSDLLLKMVITEYYCFMVNDNNEVMLSLVYSGSVNEEKVRKLLDGKPKLEIKKMTQPYNPSPVGVPYPQPQPYAPHPQQQQMYGVNPQIYPVNPMMVPVIPPGTTMHDYYMHNKLSQLITRLKERLSPVIRGLYAKHEPLAGVINDIENTLLRACDNNYQEVEIIVNYCALMLKRVESNQTSLDSAMPVELINKLIEYGSSVDNKKPQYLFQIFGKYIAKEMVEKWDKTVAAHGSVIFRVESRVAKFEDIEQYLLEFKAYKLDKKTLEYKEASEPGSIYSIWTLNLTQDFPMTFKDNQNAGNSNGWWLQR